MGNPSDEGLLTISLNRPQTPFPRLFLIDVNAEVMIVSVFFTILDSTSKCNERGSYFEWSFKAQAFSGSVIDQRFNTSDLLIGYGTEVGTLGQVPSDKAIGVFVSASLPGCVGMSEKAFYADSGGNFTVHSVFRTIVQSEGLAFSGRFLSLFMMALQVASAVFLSSLVR